MNATPLIAGLTAPLLEHPYCGAWLKITSPSSLSEPIEDLVERLQRVLGPAHPNVSLARSWAAVARGAEEFEEDTLATLRSTEPVIRTHFPQAQRALSLNLAAQGCHAWFVESAETAIAPLTGAFEIVTAQTLVCAADVLKISEVLSDCLSKLDQFDEALCVLARGYPYFLSGREQDRWIAGQFDEWRSHFVEDHGDECSPNLQALLIFLAGEKIPPHCAQYDD